MPEITLRGTKTDIIRMFQPILALNDECKLLVRKNGIECKVVDPAHVIMAQILIDKTYFSEYKTSKKLKIGEEFSIGLDIESFIESMSMTAINHSDEAVVVLDSDDDTGNITLYSEGLTFNKPFNLANSTGMSDPKLPTLTLPFVFEIKSQKKLRQIVRDISKFSDHLKIRQDLNNKNKLFIEWYDSYDNLCSYTITNKLMKTLDYTSKDDTVKSLYPTEYLDNILKGLSKAFFGDVTVKCWMGPDYPIRISAGKKPLEVNYLLAPRIESE